MYKLEARLLVTPATDQEPEMKVKPPFLIINFFVVWAFYSVFAFYCLYKIKKIGLFLTLITSSVFINGTKPIYFCSTFVFTLISTKPNGVLSVGIAVMVYIQHL